jgi:hypothetical protein
MIRIVNHGSHPQKAWEGQRQVKPKSRTQRTCGVRQYYKMYAYIAFNSKAACTPQLQPLSAKPFPLSSHSSTKKL